MTDQYPAALSSSLLARKGMADSDGFAPPKIDLFRPARPRRRAARLAALLGAAVTFGAGGTWLATQDNGPFLPDPAAAVTEAAIDSAVVHGKPDDVLNSAANPSAGAAHIAPLSVPWPRSGAGEDAKPIAQALGTMVEKPRTPTPSGHLAAKADLAAATSTYRIQLHTLRSREAVEREWAKLRRQHGDLLADKRLVINRLEVAGAEPRYRMQLGNLPTKTAARQLCRALEDRGQKCILVPTT
jgi:SPOR domain